MSFRAAAPNAPPAPAFTLSLLDGQRVTGARLWRDRPAVLVFFSSWCGPCARAQPDVDALVRRYGDAVAFLGIAGQDEPRAVAAYLDRHAVDYAVGVDEALDVWRRYAVAEPPAVVLVGRGGRLLRGWPGMIETARLQRELDRLVVDG